MKRNSLYFLCLMFGLSLVVPGITRAQSDDWNTYMAMYEKGPGSVVINMAAKRLAPSKDLPFVVITGVSFKDCDSEGLPTKESFSSLYKISDTIESILGRITNRLQVGTFTYQCERLDYYYVDDTARIRKELLEAYAKYFPNNRPSLSIKADRSWEAYLGFLYPTEEIQEYMRNQQVVIKLVQAGDNNNKPRRVDHWIYFDTEKDKNCFIEYTKLKGFKIESDEKTDLADNPYKLRISRTDIVVLPEISKLTIELKREAKKCNGDYDGWETFVVK